MHDLKKINGASLIEIIMVIAVLSIMGIAIMTLAEGLSKASRVVHYTTAQAIAQQRMEIILGHVTTQRLTGAYDFAGLSDPCAAGTPPDVCDVTYVAGADASQYIVSSAINTCDTDGECGAYNTEPDHASFKSIKVAVNGRGTARLLTIISASS